MKFVTPIQRHQGTDIDILEARKVLYEEAKAAKPERWRGSTRNWDRPATVWLNPVRQENKTVIVASSGAARFAASQPRSLAPCASWPPYAVP